MTREVYYDENEHCKECYAYFGLAVYYSQVLEHQLVNMIVLLKFSQGQFPTKSDYDVIYERKLQKTMGQLINEIRQLFQLRTEEENELKKVLKLRNFIVHDYFKENINLTFTHSGRQKIIQELNDFVESVKKLDAQLENYTSKLLNKLGISQNTLENEVRKIIKRNN